jgi:hypothetical protein
MKHRVPAYGIKRELLIGDLVVNPTVKKDKLSAKVTSKSKRPSRTSKSQKFPIVSIDHDSDFASIKLGPGIEAKSYLKDGILFSEDAKGQVIELQILNLSLTTKPRSKKARKIG